MESLDQRLIAIIKQTTRLDGSLRLRSSFASVLPITCSITSMGMAVSIALNTKADSISGAIKANSLSCTSRRGYYLREQHLLYQTLTLTKKYWKPTNAYNSRGNAYYYRGNAYYDKKDYNRAIYDYTQVIKLNPESTYAYRKRGDAYYYKKKDYNRAIYDYTQVIKLDPEDTYAYSGRGLAYKNKGSKDKAIEDFKKVLKLNDDEELSQFASEKLQELGTK